MVPSFQDFSLFSKLCLLFFTFFFSLLQFVGSPSGHITVFPFPLWLSVVLGAQRNFRPTDLRSTRQGRQQVCGTTNSKTQVTSYFMKVEVFGSFRQIFCVKKLEIAKSRDQSWTGRQKGCFSPGTRACDDGYVMEGLSRDFIVSTPNHQFKFGLSQVG